MINNSIKSLCYLHTAEKNDACSTDSRVGWSTVDRGGGGRRNLDSDHWTFVVPGLETPCDGLITQWNFWPRRNVPFRAIVWRRASDRAENYFKIVGINDIPALGSNNEIQYSVPPYEHIRTKKGDVFGFSFKTSLLAYQVGTPDAIPVRWFKNLDPYSMTPGDIYNFEGSGNRGYMLQAIITPITEGKVSTASSIVPQLILYRQPNKIMA